MNIVVLDGHTLNPGDLSWEGLRRLGTCTIHDRSDEAEIVPRASEAEIILTNKTPLDRRTIDALPRLRYVGVLATGYNIVDITAASEHGVTVTNVPSYGTMSVAQVVFAHLLNLTHRIGHHDDAIHRGRWSASTDFCFWDSPLIELTGLTMGIVGLGRIGSAVARIALAFGMDAVAFDHAPVHDPPEGVLMVTLDGLFRGSDVVSLHCPLTPSTRGLVSRERLAMMKQRSYLINTSRGPLVDEEALAEALNGGRIAGAGLDVLSAEPPPATNPLLSAKNCFLSPHFAWASTAARTRLMTEVVENVKAFLGGNRRNVVNHRRSS